MIVKFQVDQRVKRLSGRVSRTGVERLRVCLRCRDRRCFTRMRARNAIKFRMEMRTEKGAINTWLERPAIRLSVIATRDVGSKLRWRRKLKKSTTTKTLSTAVRRPRSVTSYEPTK